MTTETPPTAVDATTVLPTVQPIAEPPADHLPMPVDVAELARLLGAPEPTMPAMRARIVRADAWARAVIDALDPTLRARLSTPLTDADMVTVVAAAAARSADPAPPPTTIPAHWITERQTLLVELRRWRRAYGRASATIGEERATSARLREDRRHHDSCVRLLSAEVAEAAAKAGRDRALVEKAEQYGQELTPTSEPPAAVAALARIRQRGQQLFNEQQRHMAIGEIFRLAGWTLEPAPRPAPARTAGWFEAVTPGTPPPADVAGAPILAEVAAAHPTTVLPHSPGGLTRRLPSPRPRHEQAGPRPYVGGS